MNAERDVDIDTNNNNVWRNDRRNCCITATNLY